MCYTFYTLKNWIEFKCYKKLKQFPSYGRKVSTNKLVVFILKNQNCSTSYKTFLSTF